MKANTKIFGCIADPINHVKAPTVFTKMFQEQKINAIMIPINVSLENLESFFSGIRTFKNLKFNTEILIDDLKNYDISEYDYVINATSLGLKENKDLIFDVTKTKIDCTIIDIVMDPEETILIKEAIKYKRNYHLGKNMLVSQIKLAGNFFNLW